MHDGGSCPEGGEGGYELVLYCHVVRIVAKHVLWCRFDALAASLSDSGDSKFFCHAPQITKSFRKRKKKLLLQNSNNVVWVIRKCRK